MAVSLMPHLEAGSPADPLIVLLHGGPLSSRMWAPQMKALQGEFYLLAPDLPGHGQNHAAPFSLAEAARQTAELIRAKSLTGKACLVGLSLGGAVTLELLRGAPQVVERALVSGTAARLDKLTGWLTLALAGGMGWIPARKQAEMMVRQLAVPQAMQELVWDDFVGGATAGYTRMVTRALMEMELPSEVNCPLLAAVGGKETSAARQAAAKLLRLYPAARGIRAPGLHHLWNLDAPDLFNRTARAWELGEDLPNELIREG